MAEIEDLITIKIPREWVNNLIQILSENEDTQTALKVRNGEENIQAAIFLKKQFSTLETKI